MPAPWPGRPSRPRPVRGPAPGLEVVGLRIWRQLTAVRYDNDTEAATGLGPGAGSRRSRSCRIHRPGCCAPVPDHRRHLRDGMASVQGRAPAGRRPPTVGRARPPLLDDKTSPARAIRPIASGANSEWRADPLFGGHMMKRTCRRCTTKGDSATSRDVLQQRRKLHSRRVDLREESSLPMNKHIPKSLRA